MVEIRNNPVHTSTIPTSASVEGRTVGSPAVTAGSTTDSDKSATRFVGLNGEQKDFQSLLGGRGFRRPAGIA